MQGSVLGFYQTALAQFCTFSGTLICTSVVLSPGPAMSSRTFCSNGDALYLSGTIAMRHKWLFKFKSIKTKFKNLLSFTSCG